MSDLYDSLEDERDDGKLSSGSLDGWEIDSSEYIRRTCKGRSTDKYSFFLNENLNKEKQILHSIFLDNKALPERKIILPKIKNRSTEGLVSDIVVDKRSLDEQGLQLNKDGSFTKSPRVVEELPFITREYRNLQFQKKKTYKLNKKHQNQVKCKETNIFSFAEQKYGLNTTQMKYTGKKKGSCEGVINSFQSSKVGRLKSGKEFPTSYNLTDSMKEKLLQTVGESQAKYLKAEEDLKKAKREINHAGTKGSLHQNKISTVRKRKTDAAKSENLSSKENSDKSGACGDKRKAKKFPNKITKFKSDIVLNTIRPRLNYLERHQLENGFNPFYLRQESKKVPSDTNRSNFGDSEMEELAEVSSRVITCDNTTNEDEEIFYRKLIERDKRLKQTLQGSRSEGPVETLQLSGVNGASSSRLTTEVPSGRNNTGWKRNSKSMFIDMPCEGAHSINTSKKYSHYCSTSSSPNMSKVELVVKARTYAYLVNARNIFKLKTQSEREKNGKISVASKNPDPSEVSNKLTKQNSLPVSSSSVVQKLKLHKPSNFLRPSASLCKAEQPGASRRSQKGFALPQVDGSNTKGSKIDAKLFERISSFLESPSV